MGWRNIHVHVLVPFTYNDVTCRCCPEVSVHAGPAPSIVLVSVRRYVSRTTLLGTC